MMNTTKNIYTAIAVILSVSTAVATVNVSADTPSVVLETMSELQTEIVSEIIEITNASGETVTDENGEAETEVVTEVVMVTTSPTEQKESFIESLFSKDDEKEVNEEVTTKKEETATTAAAKETTTGEEEKTTKKSTTSSTTKKTTTTTKKATNTTTKPTTTKALTATTTTAPAETTTIKKVDESRVVLPGMNSTITIWPGEKASFYSPAQNVNLIQYVVYYNDEEVWRSPMLDGGDSCEWDIRADLGGGRYKTKVVAEVYKTSGKFATSSTYSIEYRVVE